MSKYVINSERSKQGLTGSARVKNGGSETEFELPRGRMEHTQIDSFDTRRLLRK